MSKNRYLWEDVRDFKVAWYALEQAVLASLTKQIVWIHARLERLMHPD